MLHAILYLLRGWWLAPLLLLASAAPAMSQTGVPMRGGAASSNPNVGLVLNGFYSQFSKDTPFSVPGFVLGGEPGPGPEGLNLGESELNIYGNIDPYLFGSATLAFTPEGEAEVEEAFIQTTSLPYGFAVKAGRFFSGIGYLNGAHRHADDFFEAPLPYQVFLGGQFGDDGAQLRWIAPTLFYLEVGLEKFRGEGFPAGGAVNHGAGAEAGFLKVGGDLGVSNSWLLGLSQIQAQAIGRRTGEDPNVPESSFTGDSTVNLVSVVWKWAPQGNSKTTNFNLQGEFFQREENGQFVLNPESEDPERPEVVVKVEDKNRATQSGWYAQARFQFLERWRVGLRQASVKADALKDPAAAGTVLDGGGKSSSIGSAMIEYRPSEFSQVRLQYSADSTQSDEAVGRWYLQYIVALGAHAAHSY